MGQKKYSVKLMDQVLRQVRNKENITEIANSLGLATSTVYQWVKEHFLIKSKKSKYSEQDVAKWAEEYNVTRHTIKRWLKL